MRITDILIWRKKFKISSQASGDACRVNATALSLKLRCNPSASAKSATPAQLKEFSARTRSTYRDTLNGTDMDVMTIGRPPSCRELPALILGATLLLHGCSSESVKRTAFETLQNLGEQQCEQDLSGKCPQRESYAAYLRKRTEAQSSE